MDLIFLKIFLVSIKLASKKETTGGWGGGVSKVDPRLPRDLSQFREAKVPEFALFNKRVKILSQSESSMEVYTLQCIK